MIFWIKLNHWSRNRGRVVLKFPGEEFGWKNNCIDKLFAWIGHGSSVGGVRNLGFLLEFRFLRSTVLVL